MNRSKWWTKGAEDYRSRAEWYLKEAELVLAIELEGDFNSTLRGADYWRKHHAHMLELAEYALELAHYCETGAETSEKAATARQNLSKIQGLVSLAIARKNFARSIRALTTRDNSPDTQHSTLDRLAHFIFSQGPPRELASITETLSS